MKKRLLSLLLTLVMILGLLPATAMTANAATLPEITGLHRGVMVDGEDPMMIYWDHVDGVAKYQVKVTIDGHVITPSASIRDNGICIANWVYEFWKTYDSDTLKNKTAVVEVTGGYQHGNLFIAETETATLELVIKNQRISSPPIYHPFSIFRGESSGVLKVEDFIKSVNDDLDTSKWDDVSGYPRYALIAAPNWIQLWGNKEGPEGKYGDVYITVDPPADCPVATYQFGLSVATSEVDGFEMGLQVTVMAQQGKTTDYWLQEIKLKSETMPEYWDVWQRNTSYYNPAVVEDATLIQGTTGNVITGDEARDILADMFAGLNQYDDWAPVKTGLLKGDGTKIGKNDVIDVGEYRYRFVIEDGSYPESQLPEGNHGKKILHFADNVAVYVDGELMQDTDNKNNTITVYTPYYYIYDVKPEIHSVSVNGTSVADGATVTANSKNVTIKTTYDSVLSQALTDYGCTVKEYGQWYLNGEKLNIAATTPVDNGDGTSTKTYTRPLNPGDELKVHSRLEVTWPDDTKDIVDEQVTNVFCIDADFESIYPVPTASELTNKYTDLGTMNLGSAATNIEFKAFPKKLSAAAISDGWTTGRSISVTRDGVEIYNRTYADNELFGWNLKDNIDEGGTYLITLRVFAQKGKQIVEKTHKFRVFVKGSTIKTIALEGVGTPVIGKSPSTINTVKSNTDGVVVKKVIWNYWTSEMGGNWFVMPSGSKFEAGKRYAVEIELQTADGYSFTANKSDMTVYINGEKAGKSVNYDSNKFSAELEFKAITTPAFTTQPVGGEAPYGGKYTVNWATNFTPCKIVVGEYNSKNQVVNQVEYSNTTTSVELPANQYGYVVIAYYNDANAKYSNKITITEVTPAFTMQPVGGEVEPGEKLTVTWATNFTPVKSVLMKVVTHPVDGTVTTRQTLGTASTAEVGAGYDYYFIRAYTETSYVDSNKFYVTEKSHSSMIGDLNNDGYVNDEDVILLLWHTLLPDLYPIQGDADFNADSSVNDEDVIYLLWHTLLPDLYPL